MEQDITIIFEQILKASQSIDIAESEFKRMVYEDTEMRSRYKAWCAEQEVSEKRGFVDYCMERIDEFDSCWDALTDIDESYE